MGIRKRFSIGIVLLFLINIISLLVFYKVYIYPKNTAQLDLVQKEIQNLVIENVESLDNRTSLIEAINDRFEINTIRKFSVEKLIESLLYFEIGVMCFILVLGSTLIYINYVKPIELLSKEMSNYSNGVSLGKLKKGRGEIGQLQKDFINLVNKVDEEKMKQNNIVASISHDIKTPLTSIMGYSERLVKKDFSKEKQTVYLNTIYSKGQIINELINDFDEYLSYNFEDGLNLKNYTVKEICSMLTAEYSYELRDIGVDFKVNCLCEEAEVPLDLIKFKRVIGNIISNSVKSMTENPLIEITVENSEKKDMVLFKITDTGKGVDEKLLSNIFDPLFTTDTSRKVAGLGLAICKNIVLSHGGEIVATNRDIGGFQVDILLKRNLS